MARGGRRAAREEEMRAVVERWERSGLPLSRFVDREGIARKTLYRWRRRTGVGGDRLRRGRWPRRPEDHDRFTSGAIFTEVSSVMHGPSSAATFEVVLADGTTVRVPEHFDPGVLRKLLGTLREC